MVAHDIEVMQQNAGKNLRYHYTKDGQELSFSRIWGEHVFTDEEAARLADGETISFKTKKGAVTGQLAEQEYKGKTYWGFKMDEGASAAGAGADDGAGGGAGGAAGAGSDSSSSRAGSAGKPKVTGMFEGKEVSFNAVWGKHTFTEDEIARLLAGETIKIDYTSKAGRKKTTTGKLGYKTFKGKKYFGFQPDF
jgi:DNA topoisomerase-3